MLCSRWVDWLCWFVCCSVVNWEAELRYRAEEGIAELFYFLLAAGTAQCMRLTPGCTACVHLLPWTSKNKGFPFYHILHHYLLYDVPLQTNTRLATLTHLQHQQCFHSSSDQCYQFCYSENKRHFQNFPKLLKCRKTNDSYFGHDYSDVTLGNVKPVQAVI